MVLGKADVSKILLFNGSIIPNRPPPPCSIYHPQFIMIRVFRNPVVSRMISVFLSQWFTKSSGYTDFTKSSGFIVTRSSGIQCDTGFPEFIGLVDPVVSKIQRVSQILITVVRDLVVSKFDDFRVPMVYPTSDSDSK